MKRRRTSARGPRSPQGTPMESFNSLNNIDNACDSDAGRNFQCAGELPELTYVQPIPPARLYPTERLTPMATAHGRGRIPHPPDNAAPTHLQPEPTTPTPTTHADSTIRNHTTPSTTPLPAAQMPYVGDYRGVTWNTQALIASDPSQQRLKRDFAERIYDEHDFAALQETHGTVGSVQALTLPRGCRAFGHTGLANRQV
jgi:hypothetical protein